MCKFDVEALYIFSILSLIVSVFDAYKPLSFALALDE